MSKFLDKQNSDALYRAIVSIQNVDECRASITTISRVNRCLHFGAGGYQTMVARLREQDA